MPLRLPRPVSLLVDVLRSVEGSRNEQKRAEMTVLSIRGKRREEGYPPYMPPLYLGGTLTPYIRLSPASQCAGRPCYNLLSISGPGVMTVLFLTSTRVGYSRTKGRLFPLRINRPSGQKQEERGEETRHRKHLCTRKSRMSRGGQK